MTERDDMSDMRNKFELYFGGLNPSAILFKRGGSVFAEDIDKHDYVDGNIQHQWILWQKSWQAAKESSRKELDMHINNEVKLTAEIEALEKKLAERDDEADSLIGMQQIRIQELENAAATHQANIELLASGVDDFWLAEHGDLFDDNGAFIGSTEELTKREAAARQQGFEEGDRWI